MSWAFKRFGKLPIPEFVGTTPASNHDLEVFKPQWEALQNRAIFGDKAYANKDWEIWLAQNNNVPYLLPRKKEKRTGASEFFPRLIFYRCQSSSSAQLNLFSTGL